MNDPRVKTDKRPNDTQMIQANRDLGQILKQDWYNSAEQGHLAQQGGRWTHAEQHFKSCCDIAKTLLRAQFTLAPSAISLYYYASHNHAACQNQLQQASAAEQTLSRVYNRIINLCNNSETSRDDKLDALAVLDKSLFSLCSQLAYMGKVAHIHQLIRNTEDFAETCLTKLLPPSKAI